MPGDWMTWLAIRVPRPVEYLGALRRRIEAVGSRSRGDRSNRCLGFHSGGFVKLSVIVPAHNEEMYIRRCLASVRLASRRCAGEVEVVVALNRCTDATERIARAHGARTVVEDAKNISRIRNAGVAASTGEAIVTLDADSWISGNLLAEIERRLASGRFVGGGVLLLPERLSPGILASAALLLVPALLRHGVSIGCLWCGRESFEAIGGFDEAYLSAEDVDIAIRLKRHGRAVGKRFGNIRAGWVRTSCRKWDRHGDWYLLRNWRWARSIYSGKDRALSDMLWYDAER